MEDFGDEILKGGAEDETNSNVGSYLQVRYGDVYGLPYWLNSVFDAAVARTLCAKAQQIGQKMNRQGVIGEKEAARRLYNWVNRFREIDVDAVTHNAIAYAKTEMGWSDETFEDIWKKDQ